MSEIKTPSQKRERTVKVPKPQSTTPSHSVTTRSDFYLVAVAPGRGLNGPIFLNLRGVASCPTTVAEPSKYREWYPALIPSDIHLIADMDNAEWESPQWSRTVDPEEYAVELSTGMPGPS